jgi:ribulose-5-phosphate 4-epimerase/fuculose-1-phosphate aldolase
MTKLEEYILLCKLFGASLDMVQGTGGNISVKEHNRLYIKRSGFQLSDTSEDEGYVVCDMNKLTKQFQQRNEEIKDTVLEGEGRPSMEAFFHLLPFPYIVHIHPTFLMNLLCQYTLAGLQTLFPNSLYIPYIQPGIELAEAIHKVYSGQQLIFLKNHGIIFLETSVDAIVSLAHTTFMTLANILPLQRQSDIDFLYTFYKENPTGYIKSSFLIPNGYDSSCIKSYTPDYHLFLKKPSVQMHKGIYYVHGYSKAHVENSEQMHASYALCMFDSNCQTISTEAIQTLEINPLEKERLSLFKGIN